MRKSRILSLLLAVAVMATMLVAVPLTASAASATWPTDDIYAIGQSCKIIADNYKDDFPSDLTGITKDKLIAAYATNYKTNAQITVGEEEPYKNAFLVKGINSRSFAIKVKTGCTVTIYGGINKGNMAIITDDSNEVDSNDLTNCPQTVETGYYKAVYTYDGEDEKILYISSYNSSDAYVNCIEINYTKPLIDIGYDFYLDKNGTDGDQSKTLKVTTQNMGEESPQITWENEKDEVVKLDNKTNTSATVTAIGEAGTQSTITASCTYNDTTYTASCIAKIGSNKKDVVIKGCSGLKKVTLTPKGESSPPYTAKWERTTLDDGSVASVANNDNLGGEDYSQSDRGFLRTIKDVPIGEYDVTYTFADEYYEDSGKNPKTLNIDFSSEYSVILPAIKVSSTPKKDTTAVNGTADQLAGKIIKWDFTQPGDNYNNYLSLENTAATNVYANNAPNVFMQVDTSAGGKFTSDQSGDRIQIRESKTILTVPVIKGSIVTVVTYNSPTTDYIKINDVARDTYVAEADGTAKIECYKSNCYINTITIASVFGTDIDTDYGLYTDETSKSGVIRFFQSFVEGASDSAEVKEYGFYFLDSNAETKDSNFKASLSESINFSDNAGMYGDLIGIAEDNFKEQTFYALPFVNVNDEIIYGNYIECTVNDEPKTVNKPQEPQE